MREVAAQPDNVERRHMHSRSFIVFCRTIQISHADDNADPQNGRSPALRCSGWFGSPHEFISVQKNR
jgi:hypothetical protein